MQPTSITLAVDTLGDGTTVVDEDLSRYDEYQNRSVYISEDHSLVSPETMTLYRTFPKTNGNFLGVAKNAIKFSYSFGVDGADGVSTINAPCIIEISASVPVGLTPAQTLLMRERARAGLKHAFSASLYDVQMV